MALCPSALSFSSLVVKPVIGSCSKCASGASTGDQMHLDYLAPSSYKKFVRSAPLVLKARMDVWLNVAHDFTPEF